MRDPHSTKTELARKQFFDEAFTHATVGAALVASDKKLQRVNPKFCKLLGYTERELIGNQLNQFVHAEDQKLHEKLEAGFHSRDTESLFAEIRCISKEGKVRWLQITESAFTDENRCLKGSTLIAQDISQRVTNEQRYQESDQRFSSTFENAAVGIAHLAPDGHWLRVNHKMCVITGYAKEELLKLKFEDITHPLDSDADWDLANKVLSGKIENYSMDKRYIRKDGSTTWVGLTVSLQRDSRGTPLYFISIIRDINARKQAEKALINREEELLKAKEAAENASRSKDEFLSVMSHELHTPLNPIIGFAQLLREGSQDPSFVKEAANFTLVSARRMLELVDSVLSFAQLDKKDKNLAYETFELANITQEISILEQNQEDAPPIKIQNGSPTLQKISEAEQFFAPLEAISQCVRNLTNNALKYGGKHGATLTIGLIGDRNGSRNSLRIEVSDQGPGIPPSYVPSLFSPFNQADNSSTRKHDGIGLGLAICEKLAAQMEGRIDYRPNQPHGAIFSLTIPVKVLNKDNRAEPKLSTSERTNHEQIRPTILIIEDNQENADYFTFALQEFDVETIHVSSGEEAINLCKSKWIHIALIDISMAGLSGLETLEELKKIPGFYERTTCIAVTAHASDSMRKVCLKQGFHAFLSKPVTLPALRHTIQNLLVESQG